MDDAQEVEGGMVTSNPPLFFKKLSEFGRFRGEEDKIVWKASKNGVFSVRSFYNALEDGR